MENIIEQLIKIEEAAKQETYRLDKERKQLPARISAQTAVIRARVEKEAQEEIDALQLRLAAETAECVEEHRRSCEARAAAMEALYAQNADTWCKQIFADVIGR